MGSLFEIETQLIISQELGFLFKEDLINEFELIKKEGKMINALINKIKNC